jgi:HAD superfamily phosphatase (TIGR01668 family)
MFTFVPEYYFNTFDEANVEFLASIGVKGIVLDIDNTLEPYEHPKAGEHVKAWFDSLKAAGIKTAIVSNNNAERVKIFNDDFGMPAYSRGAKPFKKNILSAISDMGIKREEAILMGDQIFTDVWAAHNAKIPAILVPPINDKRDILTRFKRLLEKPIMAKYHRKKGRNS